MTAPVGPGPGVSLQRACDLTFPSTVAPALRQPSDLQAEDRFPARSAAPPSHCSLVRLDASPWAGTSVSSCVVNRTQSPPALNQGVTSWVPRVEFTAQPPGGSRPIPPSCCLRGKFEPVLPPQPRACGPRPPSTWAETRLLVSSQGPDTIPNPRPGPGLLRSPWKSDGGSRAPSVQGDRTLLPPSDKSQLGTSTTDRYKPTARPEGLWGGICVLRKTAEPETLKNKIGRFAYGPKIKHLSGKSLHEQSKKEGASGQSVGHQEECWSELSGE